MKTKIIQICKQIEKEKNIKILFCIESGSRVWRMESKNSDYDVRFIYVRPIEDYITINKTDEVIMKAYDKEGNIHSQEGCYIDMCGFDIFKFLRMLSSSNPTVIEWLMSDINYYGEKPQVFVDYAINSFKKISLYYHYKSMCRQNYLKYLKSGNLVTYKKYLYAMRGLINAKYIIYYGKVPPINFETTLWHMGSEHFNGEAIIPEHILHKVYEVIQLKKTGKEKDIVQNIQRIDNYIEDFLKDDSEAPKEKQLTTTTELNKELQRMLLK